MGDFLGIDNGTKNKLEIFDCDCDVSLLQVHIDSNGQNVVFHRVAQTQRFALPYQVTVDRVDATYDRNREGGTLTLVMTKPTAGASGGNVRYFLFSACTHADSSRASSSSSTCPPRRATAR